MSYDEDTDKVPALLLCLHLIDSIHTLDARITELKHLNDTSERLNALIETKNKLLESLECVNRKGNPL